MVCRCHCCILAARSDYFRAFLERSPAQQPLHSRSSSSSAHVQSPTDTESTLSASQSTHNPCSSSNLLKESNIDAESVQSQSASQSSTDRNTQTSHSYQQPAQSSSDSTHQDIASSAQNTDHVSVRPAAVSCLGANAVQQQHSSAADADSCVSSSESQQQHASADNAELYLSGSGSQQQHTSAHNAGPCLSSSVSQRQNSTADNAQQQLPVLPVSDVSSDVFQLVLEFAYSGAVQVLAPQWLKASGAELLFEAAERYLLPLLKVSTDCLLPLDLEHSSIAFKRIVLALEFAYSRAVQLLAPQ